MYNIQINFFWGEIANILNILTGVVCTNYLMNHSNCCNDMQIYI